MRIAAVPVATGEDLSSEFEALYREHYALIYRTAYSITGSRPDAEDVLQTIFLRLLRRALPPDLENNPQGYLYRAAVNLSLNILRARTRRTMTELVEDLPTPLPDASEPDDEMRRRLLQAIAGLRPRAVEILILRYEHDRSDAEIAKMLGTSRGTIAVTLYRTRARLKKILLRTASGGDR